MAVAPVPYQAPRAKRSGRTLIFVLGAGMAVLAFVAVFVVGVFLQAGSSATRQVTAVVALHDIQPRELITSSSVTVAMVPSASLPPHSIVRMADLVGDTALVTIYKGQVLSQSIVAANPDQIDQTTASYLPIPQGFVAITIPTNELQGVAGYVSAGDYINVIASVNTKLLLVYKGQVVDTHDTGMVTRTVFTSVRVIRVGPPTLGPKNGQQQGVSSSLTIVVSECDAQFIDWFINNASLKYVLLSYQDYAPAPATADTSCPSTVAPSVVGPQQVNSRWNFTKG
ncbi:MAG TPA: Flp pilus assembly protein CpaB [Candidatus Dormibacteraeota bacterium]